jgi:hypothetical protein
MDSRSGRASPTAFKSAAARFGSWTMPSRQLPSMGGRRPVAVKDMGLWYEIRATSTRSMARARARRTRTSASPGRSTLK